MEQIIVKDYETSDGRVNFGQIIQAGILITDDKLKIKQKHELRCRLKPTVIPSIGASLVHRATVDQLKNSNMSHYQLAMEHYKIIKNATKDTPSFISGFNNIAFDLEFTRRMYFKNLIPDVYQTNTNGNKHLDILNVARASKFANNYAFKTILSDKGRPSFRLEDLCKANSINNGTSHDAITDCLNTISLAEIIYKKTPEIWDAALNTAAKNDVENFILKNKIYTSLEYFYGRSVAFACHHILFHEQYKWSINWDLKVDPSKYLDMDRQTLSKALDSAPKVLRTVRQNKSPVLLKSDYALNTENYSKIGKDEINRRVKVLDDNPQFIQLVSTILSDKAKEKMTIDQTELLHEETIYKSGFASQKDKTLMNRFHQVDWKERVNLIDKFSEERFQYFAECLIYEESPESLPKSIYNKIHRSFAQRLLSTNKEKWETTASFFNEVDNLRENKYKDDPEMLEKIEGYNNHVMEIQSRFENA